MGIAEVGDEHPSAGLIDGLIPQACGQDIGIDRVGQHLTAYLYSRVETVSYSGEGSFLRLASTSVIGRQRISSSSQ
jgi:hypothetical protein